ncbi:hypothetical protein B9G55_11590 [Saccharibacillus sp. O16]|nr:hypothetical protein B9G55_11590 [Saccharibacillus sp. O16]
MNFYAGIDGGGTKTELAAIDERGAALCQVRGTSTNPHTVGFDKAFMELTSIFKTFLEQPQLIGRKCLGICLGMSGIDHEDERLRLTAFLKEELQRLRAPSPFEIRTEGEIALMAALGRPYGLQIIAGTGSIVYGFLPDEPRARAGGWGHLLGDEGSGYRLGLEALRLTAREFDRAGLAAPRCAPMEEAAEGASSVGAAPVAPQAASEGAEKLPPPGEAAAVPGSAGSGAAGLAASVREALGLHTPEDLKRWVYAPGTDKAAIAAVAETAIRACEAGDPDARRIVADEAANLAATTAGLLRHRPAFAEGDAVLGGSIFGHSPSFREAFAQALAAEFPKLRLVDGAGGRSAAEGAALLARQIFGGA